VVSQRPAEWFRNEERNGVDALAGWIRHPSVRGVLERRGVAAETTVMLFAEFPDGTEEPNPFDRAEAEHWPLTPAQRGMTDHRADGDLLGRHRYTPMSAAIHSGHRRTWCSTAVCSLR
jgi:hypothetical protein